MRIGIVYGHISSNLGDVAINHGTAAMLRKVAPDAHVHVVLLNLAEDQLLAAEAAFGGIENRSFAIVRTRANMSAHVSEDLAELALATKYVLDPSQFIADAGLTGCDAILYNSGEHVFAYERNDNHINLLWRLLPALAAKAAGMRFVVLPATVGPFEAPSLEPMLRSFFTLSDAMAVRETVSAQMAAEFLGAPPPPVLLDPAFFLSGAQHTASTDVPTLALVMRPEGFGLRVGRRDSVSARAGFRRAGFRSSNAFSCAVDITSLFLSHVAGRVHLIIGNEYADCELTQAVAQALTEKGYGENVRVVQPTHVAAYQEELARADFIVASRFHACILGLVAGTPVMGVYFEDHGHKMPGLFQLLGMPDYCLNLSRTSPASAAEAVVALFHSSEKAFAEMHGSLHAMREETLGWLSQALEGKATMMPEQRRVESTAYLDAIEAIRSRMVLDLLPGMDKERLTGEILRLKAECAALAEKLRIAREETIRLKSELAKERRALQQIRKSLPYQLGNALVRPVRKPGLFALRVAYRVAARSPSWVKGIILKAASKSKMLAALQSVAETASAHGRSPKGGGVQSARRGAHLSIPDNYVAEENRVVYLAHMSLPYTNNGYSIRTHGLMKGLLADGWHMYGVTRLGFPFDTSVRRGLNVPSLPARKAIPDKDVVENAEYWRILDGGHNLRTLKQDAYLQKYLDNAFSLCVEHRPALIHGASNYLNGIVATDIARILGIPSVYEVRGLWELTRVSIDPNYEGTEAYHNAVKMETEACRQATAVIAITRGVKNILIQRGIPDEKIVVVPNGVDTDRFVPRPRDIALEAQLGYAGKKVIGYSGAFAPYEGLEYLLQAAAILRNRRDDFRVLLVGDGESYDRLQSLCDNLRLRGIVTIAGRVPHKEIERYYSLMDVVALPRRGLPVCEVVSPLKPFEAMAMGKAVVASDVDALSEIILDGETGLLHKKDDVEHLAHELEMLLDNPELMRRLGDGGRDWVVANRDWRKLAKDVGDLYREVLSRKAKPNTASSGADRVETPVGRAATAIAQQAVEQADVQSGDRRVATVEQGGERLRVAAIMDRFTYECFRHEAFLITFTPENWTEVLSHQRPDILLVESAWEGNAGAWHHKVGKYTDDEFAPLVALVNYCRQAGIPTVFFNKEDPVHFNRFKETAALFDHVFTTDADCIPRYLDLKSPHMKTVKAMPFAAQPAIHNPTQAGPRENSVCYAGTYYANKFDARCAQLDVLLDAAAGHDLVIYDRQAGTADTPYRFPERFWKCIQGSLDYADMVKAYKKHRVFLNANSVTDSPTMCSRRVFEIIASGAAVVSGPSKAIELIFGDAVPIVQTPDSARTIIDRLMTDEDYYRSCVSTASRIVWRSHTYAHRLAEMASTAGLSVTVPRPVAYSALAVGTDDTGIERLLESLSSQTHPPSELLIGLRAKNGQSADVVVSREDDRRGICHLVFNMGDRGVEQSYSVLAGKAASDWVAIVSPQHEYGEHCFEDLASSVLYARADVIGKSSYYYRDAAGVVQLHEPDSEHRFDRVVFPHAVLARRSIVAARGWSDLPDETSRWQHGLMKEGILFYSADRDSFVAGEPARAVEGATRILVAGHDLKFITGLCREFVDHGHTVEFDNWDGHEKHDVDRSLRLLEDTDVIICEWCLGNAVWYSQNKRPDQRLIVRFHRQEMEKDFPAKVDLRNVDAMVFVGPHTRRDAIAHFSWEKWAGEKLVVVPNYVDVTSFDLPKPADSQFRIGIVGIVPQMKRFDLALDILEKLRQEDKRFHLHVKGKLPEEYPWMHMKKRADQLLYYRRQMDRLTGSALLKGAVHFDGWGDDMPEWYQKMGFVLSVSDFESFHLSVPEGAAARAVPMLLKWEGAEEIYPEDWSHHTADDIATAILDIIRSGRVAEIAESRRAFVEERFDIERVSLMWLDIIHRGTS